MAITKLIEERLICIGDKICTPIEQILNKTLSAVPGVNLLVKVPTGVIFSSQNLGQGVFNSVTNVWTIGTMTPGQVIFGELCWEVTDDCQAPFKFTFTLNAESDAVCLLSDENEYCVVVDGLTGCDSSTFKPIKTIVSDYITDLIDYTILIDASLNPVTITLLRPIDAYRLRTDNSKKSGGKEYQFKVIDLTNAVIIQTPDGKIVDFSTPSAATNTYNFSLIGQTILLQSDGTNYYVKTI